MTINTSGNVGVGTTTPAYPLSVNGAVEATQLRSTDINSFRLGNTGDNNIFTCAGSSSNVNIKATGEIRLLSDGLDEATNTRMIIAEASNIGIGSSNPARALDVAGNIQYTGSLIDASDRRLKKNIESLPNPLNTIMDIEAVSFVMKDDPSEQLEYGVIAQQVEEVLPALVHTKEDEQNTKSVNYSGFIGWLIEAMKELNMNFLGFQAEQERAVANIKQALRDKDQCINALKKDNQELKDEMQSIRELLKEHNLK